LASILFFEMQTLQKLDRYLLFWSPNPL